jgi:hypothetical protein
MLNVGIVGDGKDALTGCPKYVLCVFVVFMFNFYSMTCQCNCDIDASFYYLLQDRDRECVSVRFAREWEENK